jgi:DNA-directed RNA polymerase
LDGTCNGLQWYAALSRDEASAKSVNIVPSERPESVYAVVTDEFKRLVEADLTSDEMFRQRGESLKVASLAREVLPYCTLDTCKTPTMTTVYGVTLVGMIEQVRVSMIEQGMDRDTATRTKQYATTRVRGAIAKAASGANDTMAWLRECARIIVQGSRQPVAWTTPLGWPVIQPYRKLVRKNIKTITGTLEWYYPDPEAPPALKKQVDGVAANFIHSLDATHMMMTARRCRDENIWFGPVHDSYWTHASMCGRLGSVLREEFVYINGLDPLNRLAAEWAERYPGLDLPPPPPQGSLNLEVVMDSPYFFS